MTKSEFISLCLAALVAPEVALENDAVRAALMARDDAAVHAAIANEF